APRTGAGHAVPAPRHGPLPCPSSSTTPTSIARWTLWPGRYVRSCTESEMGKSPRGMTLGRVSALRVLDGAKRHATRDVLVIGKCRDGGLFLASSMPNRSSQELQAQMTVMREALMQMARYHRNAQRAEEAERLEAEMEVMEDLRRG